MGLANVSPSILPFQKFQVLSEQLLDSYSLYHPGCLPMQTKSYRSRYASSRFVKCQRSRSSSVQFISRVNHVLPSILLRLTSDALAASLTVQCTCILLPVAQ